MYATNNLVDNRLDVRRSVMSGRSLDSSASNEVFRDDYERMLGQRELMGMLGKQAGYRLPRKLDIPYPKKEEEGSYPWKRAAPQPMDKVFASAYKRN